MVTPTRSERQNCRLQSKKNESHPTSRIKENVEDLELVVSTRLMIISLRDDILLQMLKGNENLIMYMLTPTKSARKS